METCHVCDKAFSDAVLLYDDDGRICPECDAERHEQDAARRTLWSLIASGPVLCVAATFSIFASCMPAAALIFLPIAPLFALIGIIQGVRALRVGLGVHAGMGPREKSLLLASGGISIAWGLLAIAWSGSLLVAALWVRFAG